MAFTGMAEKEIVAKLSAIQGDKNQWLRALPSVASLLSHPANPIKAKALWVLGEMGLLHPDQIQPYTNQIADLLADPDPKLRERAVGALGRIGRARYELIAPYKGEMRKLACDEAAPVRMNFIWAAENIATNCPQAFADTMEIFASLLADEALRVRIEAPEIFRVLGKRRPSLVAPYLAKLADMAQNDEDRVVRIHAAGAIKAASGDVSDF